MAKVLIVDDEKVILSTCRIYLSRRGHEVMTAGKALEGLETLMENPDTDIIFCDYDLTPEMTGYDFSKAVKTDRAYGQYHNIPIIGIGDFPENEREFLADCQPKPVLGARLLEWIGEYCK